MKDLQIFGEMSINYIKNNSNYGDICISTIIYEFNIISIKNLIKRGIKLIHTVHTLTPLKLLYILYLFFHLKYLLSLYLK